MCSDDSIFNGQTGFRRAELNPASNDGTDASTEGVKTVHFSLMKDSERSLNLSHEYQLFFLESKFVFLPPWWPSLLSLWLNSWDYTRPWLSFGVALPLSGDLFA